jgi:hypothetical protein
MNLVSVANGVAAVESRISDLQRELVEQRSSLPIAATESLKQELTRFEEDVSPALSFFFPLQGSLRKVPCLKTGRYSPRLPHGSDCDLH